MVLSSRRGKAWWRRCVAALVAEQGPEDVDAASGEGDHGLGVGASLTALLEVVPVWAVTHRAG